MIATKINLVYNHQHHKIQNFNDNIYVADYTEYTKTLPTKRGVEFFSPIRPIDIPFFTLQNLNKLQISGIDFDNKSFICFNGNTLTQCESVFFPRSTTSTSWILFCELKYSSLPLKNRKNLRKAIKQLYKTRYYYYQNAIISSTNTSYLIAALPEQSEPFANFIIPPPILTKLKRNKNIILRLKNFVEIQDDSVIMV